jgi:serine protease Do
MKPGTQTRLKVWREGKEQELDIRVGELEDNEAVADTDASDPAKPAATLGMAVRPLTPDEKERVQTKGALVVEQVSGAAATAGVQPGDIVLGVNGKRVDSVAALRDAVKGRNTVALLIQREDARSSCRSGRDEPAATPWALLRLDLDHERAGLECCVCCCRVLRQDQLVPARLQTL